jgi:uncharacterized protein YcnI
VAAVAAGAVLLVAAPAAAHVEPEPNRVKPGKEATVEFTTEHGCEGSPTIKMTFRVPKGVTDAAPVEQAGWTGTVEGRKVVFSGGPAPGDEPAPFSISFTAPDKKGEMVWKVVQQCEEGVDRWIETDPEGDKPAPRVGVGQKPSGEHEDESDDHGGEEEDEH